LAVNEEKEKKGHGTENVAFLLGENVFFAGCKSFPHRKVPYGKEVAG
jgi:hypothetical protein